MYKKLVKKTVSSCHAYFRRKSMRKRAVTRAELSCHTWLDRVNRFLDPWEWIDNAMKAGVRAIVIAMTGFQDVSVLEAAARDMEELRRKAKQETLDFKVIYGMETMLENGSLVNLLAKSQMGLEELYRLAEIVWQNREKRPFLRKSEINRHRDGLLVGCPGKDGEVYRRILKNLDDACLEEIAGFYDYLSVLPPQHYQTQFKLGSPLCGIPFRAEDMICRIVALGKKAGKPIVALGNARTANQNWGMFRTSANYNILKTEGFDLNWDEPKNSILCEMLKEENLEWDGDTFLPDPLYAEELLDFFSFLGKDAAEEIVIHAPNRLVDLCEELRVFPNLEACKLRNNR